MNVPLNASDPYVRRARLQPALLVALPVALAVLAYFPSGIVGWGILWSLLVWCGGTALVAQVARDQGKRKEPELFERWGGKPTTRQLRYRDAANQVILNRLHKRLQILVTGVRVPTAVEEQANPNHADEVYEACTSFLLEKTRNKEQFPLIFEENCNYGFRRNLWGMKPIGILTSGVGSGAILLGLHTHVLPVPMLANISEALCLLLLIAWTVWFTPAWVRIAADSYAERLLAACDSLEPQRV